MYTAFFRDISGRKRAETQLATLGHAIESTTGTDFDHGHPKPLYVRQPRLPGNLRLQ